MGVPSTFPFSGSRSHPGTHLADPPYRAPRGPGPGESGSRQHHQGRPLPAGPLPPFLPLLLSESICYQTSKGRRCRPSLPGARELTQGSQSLPHVFS